MPIIFNNVNTPQNNTSTEEKLAQLQKEIEHLKSRAPIRATVAKQDTVVENLPVSDSPDHHLLVVDGKAKKIGKRSQYLVDMMTTEE
jgi:hypothetical protein